MRMAERVGSMEVKGDYDARRGRRQTGGRGADAGGGKLVTVPILRGKGGGKL